MSWKRSRLPTVILADSKKVDHNVIPGGGSGFPKKKNKMVRQIPFVLCIVQAKKCNNFSFDRMIFDHVFPYAFLEKNW